MAPTSPTPVVVPFGLADWLMSSESSDEVTAQFCAQFGCNVHAEAGTNKTLSVDIVFIDAIGESERN